MASPPSTGTGRSISPNGPGKYIKGQTAQIPIGKMSGNAWDNLESWGPKIIRYHMDMPGLKDSESFEAYAARFREATQGHIEHVGKILDEAHARGMKLIPVGHSAGG